MRAVIKNGTVCGYTHEDKQGVEFLNPAYKIGKNAFKGCKYKFNINIPMGVVSIEDDAFTNSKFSIINIPYSVTKLGKISGFKGRIRFQDRYSLVGLEIDESWDKKNIFFGRRMQHKHYILITLYLQIILVMHRVFGFFTFKETVVLCFCFIPAVGIYKTIRVKYLEHKWGRGKKNVDGDIRTFK